MYRARRFLTLAPVAGMLASSLLLGGCSARGPQTWRLVPRDRAQLLVPPGVAKPATTEATFMAAAPQWRNLCAPQGNAVIIQKRGKRVRVSVSQEALLKQPAGWLAEWTATAEAQGCLARGSGMAFAMRILDAVPLDPSAAYRLLHGGSMAKGYIDLGPETRLQVITPIIKDGADPYSPINQIGPTTGTDAALNVTVHMSEAAQYGVETAWYTFRPRADGNGDTIVAVSAERRLNNHTEPAAAPLNNYFRFAPSAAFYRLYYKADLADNSVTEIIIEPLRARNSIAAPNVCAAISRCANQSDPEMCMVIPRRVAVNPFMMVTVNGAEVRLMVGSRVRNAIVDGGGPRQAQDVIPQLAVYKPFQGKLAPVEFDRSRQDILNLALLGGESIAWK